MVLCVIYLLIPLLMCPSVHPEWWLRSQKALQASSLALSSVLSPSDPFGHVKMLPSVHMGGGWVCFQKDFSLSFKMNDS